MKAIKKLILLLALLFASSTMYSQHADSKNVNQLFKEFSKERSVTRVSIGRVPMTFINLFSGMRGVRGVEVLDFSESPAAVKERLNRNIRSLQDDDFEKLMSVNDSGQRVDIWVRTQRETIRELVVMASGDDTALIRIRGRIRLSELDNVMSNVGNTNRR